MPVVSSTEFDRGPNSESISSQRRAGVCMHLSSLPGPHGIGTIGAPARRFVDTLTAMGQSVWQFLPLGPTGYGDSPYQALSTFAGNEMLIDIGDLVELGLLTSQETRPLLDLPAGSVDYGALQPLKTSLLTRAAERFSHRADASLRQELDEFIAASDTLWLHDYALFQILKTQHELVSWTAWDEAYAERADGVLGVLERDHAETIASVKLVQFLFHRQWQALRAYAGEKGVVLFGDMPIYVALDSADAWARPELLQLERGGLPTQVAGVPPDYFSEDGQLWGNPLYDWSHHDATAYRWWVSRLRHCMQMMDLVRIDHFRGFEAYWSVPAAAETARDGAWIKGPGDKLFDAMRQALGTLPIVAEDLGVITDEVNELRRRQGFPGMKVLQFLIAEPDFDPGEIGEDCVCYTGTHDNDTVMGWFSGGPGDVRSSEEIQANQDAVLKRTGGSAQTVHLDLIRMALESAAATAVVPMQDYLGLGSEARMNIPGTASGNWCWRLEPDLLSEELIQTAAAMAAAAGRS